MLRLQYYRSSYHCCCCYCCCWHSYIEHIGSQVCCLHNIISSTTNNFLSPSAATVTHCRSSYRCCALRPAFRTQVRGNSSRRSRALSKGRRAAAAAAHWQAGCRPTSRLASPPWRACAATTSSSSAAPRFRSTSCSGSSLRRTRTPGPGGPGDQQLQQRYSAQRQQYGAHLSVSHNGTHVGLSGLAQVLCCHRHCPP